MDRDARIENVVQTLDDPEDYLRGIIGSFVSNRFSRDEAVVRIGTSGKGITPNYSIEQGWIDKPLGIGHFERRMVFHGRSHKEILADDFKGESWGGAMTYIDIQGHLARAVALNKIN
ncbi:MAG: hypothetical protein ABSG88_03770 [Bradyrhizobium sp.]